VTVKSTIEYQCEGGIDCICYLAYYGYDHALMEAMFCVCCILALASASLACATDAILDVPFSNTIEPLKFQGSVTPPTEQGKDQSILE
jgi:hypothetical protein